jgi:hypothetical protein
VLLLRAVRRSPQVGPHEFGHPVDFTMKGRFRPVPDVGQFRMSRYRSASACAWTSLSRVPICLRQCEARVSLRWLDYWRTRSPATSSGSSHPALLDFFVRCTARMCQRLDSAFEIKAVRWILRFWLDGTCRAGKAGT